MKSRIQFAIFNNVWSFGFRYIGVYYVYISYGLRLSALLTGWRGGGTKAKGTIVIYPG